MTVPYRARVDERSLLNLPGYHSEDEEDAKDPGARLPAGKA